MIIWAYQKFEGQNKWYFKVKAEKYDDIGKTCNNFGKDLCYSTPVCHAISGHDTTSYFWNRKSYKTNRKKLLPHQGKIAIIDDLAKKTHIETVLGIRKFIHVVMYSKQ